LRGALDRIKHTNDYAVRGRRRRNLNDEKKTRPQPTTGRAAGATAATFALVGAVFACVDCAVEDFRGKHDAWNGAAGGAAAGAALGVRLGSAGATAGAVAALAATAAGVDVFGRSLVANRERAAAKTASYPAVSSTE